MNVPSTVDRLRESMQRIGYRHELLFSGYNYAYITGTVYTTNTISLAAFAQAPPSYRNACMGVIVSNGRSVACEVAEHRFLGAPLIFEIAPDAVRRWKVTSQGDPELRQDIPLDQIEEVFTANKSKWSPERIFRAKAISSTPELVQQLDFIDIGLMPALEGLIRQKLDLLLRNALVVIANAYESVCSEKPDIDEVFRLVFRFIAAKLLLDREHDGDWFSEDGATVLQAVEEYYHIGSESLLSENARRPEMLSVAWGQISSSFHFQNLSVDDLAFIYENTLITPETRRELGIHSTPRQVAEYMVQKLPFEDLLESDRRVLEPCAGHGVFLITAMRRLRELLAPNLSDQERHSYFVNHLAGIEIDPFAREVCHLSLILADYPNPDGWRLYNEDVFVGGRLEEELRSAEIVLCNPPFEYFKLSGRAQIEREGFIQPPAELLRRILESPPRLLGIVLPRVFNFGLTYRSLHARLARAYGKIELVALPEVFNYSDSPTVLLLASNRGYGGIEVEVTCREVTRRQSDALSIGSEPPGRTRILRIPDIEDQIDTFALWTPHRSALWSYLDDFPKLGDKCEIHRGVNWKGRPGKHKQTQKRTDVISVDEKNGYKEGFAWVKDCFCQYSIRCERYLSLLPGDQHDGGYKHRWDLPKVAANKARLSRGPWRLGAVADPLGRAFSERFYAFWPSGLISIYALAAVLNSPVANAYVYDKDQEIDNRKRTLDALPLPPLPALAAGGAIDSLSQEIHFQFQHLSGEGGNTDLSALERLLIRIDVAVIQAYDLPSGLESDLLSVFVGKKRPLLQLDMVGYDNRYEYAKAEYAAELRQTARIDRYQELVTREFTAGLSADEAKEMEQLGSEIDNYYGPYYDKILATSDRS